MCMIGNAQHYFFRLILLFLASANSFSIMVFLAPITYHRKWVFSHRYNGPATPTTTLSHSTIMDDCCDIPLSPGYSNRRGNSSHTAPHTMFCVLGVDCKPHTFPFSEIGASAPSYGYPPLATKPAIDLYCRFFCNPSPDRSYPFPAARTFHIEVSCTK